MKKLIFFLAANLFSVNSFGWGVVAHRASAIIAESTLQPNVRAQIYKILNNQSLSDVSTWADEIRPSGKYPQASAYHFSNMEDGVTYLDYLRGLPTAQRNKGDMVMAILQAHSLLLNKNISPNDKSDILKFLIHFVGDLHQPLHSGRGVDLGGNKISVVWFGRPTNLHSLWDSQIIMTGHSNLFNSQMSPAQMGMAYATYLARSLSRTPTDARIDVNGWLDESLQLRVSSYNPNYNNNQTQYLKDNLSLVDQRVYECGIRLGSMLNQIFNQLPPPPSEVSFWMKVQGIVGDLFKIISFKPTSRTQPMTAEEFWRQ